VGGDGADAERVLRLGRAHLGVVLGFLIADWAVYTIEKEMDEKMVKGTSQKWSENGEKCDNRGMRDRHSTGTPCGLYCSNVRILGRMLLLSKVRTEKA
jgi:hypothetical protein